MEIMKLIQVDFLLQEGANASVLNAERETTVMAAAEQVCA